MADLSQIEIPSGEVFNIKDAAAREYISKIRDAITGGVHFLGVTTTEISDGSFVSPITIGEKKVTQSWGDIVFYHSKEFIWDGGKWVEFGDLRGLKSFAYKDSASGNYIPEGQIARQSFSGNLLTATGHYTPYGIISQPIFKGSKQTLEFKGSSSGDVEFKFTPKGRITGSGVSVETSNTKINSIKTKGSLPELNASFDGDTLVLNFNAGSLPTVDENIEVATGISSASISGLEFSGTEETITAHLDGESVSYKAEFTPEGTVTAPKFTGTKADVVVKGTPTGDISQAKFAGKEATITVT